MIDETSYYVLVSCFLTSCFLMHYASGRSLRAKILLDPYVFLYILVGSMVAVHIDIFSKYNIDPFFIFSYSLSILIFFISFAYSSYIYNRKISKLQINEKTNITNSKIISTSSVVLLSLFCIVFLYFDIEESIQKISSIDAVYSENLIYLNENPYARYLFYAKGSVSLIFTFFLVSLFYYRNNFFDKFLMAMVIICYVFSTFLAGNRSSVVTSFLIFGLFVMSEFSNLKLRSIISKIQLYVFVVGVTFAIYITSQSLNDDALLAVFALLERVVLGSDIGYRFHLSGTIIDLSNFQDYDFTYFIKPLLTLLGIKPSSPGIGPQVLIAAGINEYGKGPIPTFFYDSFIISKSYIFPFFYSSIVGILIPTLRYYAVTKFAYALLKRNPVQLAAACIIFLMSAGPTGDYLSFFNNVVLNIINLLIFYLLILTSKINFINYKK